MSKVLYHSIARDICNKINTGQLKPGDMIPSESQLTAAYNASRMTVRKGLALLAEAGYLTPVPGKGVFVAEPKYDELVLRFNEMDLVKEDKEEVQLLEVNLVKPGRLVEEKLHLGAGAKAVVIKRLLRSRKEPVAYDVKYLPYDKGKPIVEREIHYATFPEIAAKHGELFSVKNELTITAGEAGSGEAKVLGVKPGSALLIIEQTLFSMENRVIGWGRIFCRPDRYQLQAVSSLHAKTRW